MTKLILFIFFMILSLETHSEPVPVVMVEEASNFRSDKSSHNLLCLQIMLNNKNLDYRKVISIAKSADQAAKAFDVPANIVLAIAFVESSYRLNAVNKHSEDYGIMQVNKWHVTKSKLNVNRLLTDLDYSFHHGVRIFSWFYKNYPLDEAIKRYNCGTSVKCVKYKKVKKYLDKVKRSL